MATNNDPVPSTSKQADSIARIPRFSDFTRNPFVNFSRSYHRAGLRATEAVKRAATDWRQLSPHEKDRFRRQAEFAPYRVRTRNRTFNRILKLLDSTNDEEAEEDSSNGSGDTAKITKATRMIERWKVRSYRSAVLACTQPQGGATRTKRKTDPQMIT